MAFRVRQKVVCIDDSPTMSNAAHTIKGKPLAEASDDDLRAEYDAGMWFDCQEGLTPDQEKRLLAVEAEMAKRSDAARESQP